MHPIERLRYVARAGAVEQAVLVRETADALAPLGADPPGLVTACRRLLERHPAAGPLWWLTSRALTAGDALAEARRAVDEFDADGTPRHLADSLPDDAVITVVGWPEQVAEALPRRGDLCVRVIDAGEGSGLVRRLARSDIDAVLVPDAGAGPAAASADVVVVEAVAAGPGAFVAVTGTRALAAVARHAGVPVWLVAGVGRVLPPAVWRAVSERITCDQPWDGALEVVPLDLVDTVVGPDGRRPVGDLAGRSDCPVAPELLQPSR